MTATRAHAHLTRANQAVARNTEAVRERKALIGQLAAQHAPPDILENAKDELRLLENRLAELQARRDALHEGGAHMIAQREPDKERGGRAAPS
jgi:hypothetical protein